MKNHQVRQSHQPIFILHFAFLLAGFAAILLGQVLPVLARKLSMNDNQSGQLFIIQFIGSLIGNFIYSYTIKRFGSVFSTIFGLIFLTFGCLIINANDWLICSFGFVILGIGIGATITAINMFIAEINPSRVASALNILNFFWGVGAILCQPFIAFLSTSASVFLPTAILAFSFFVTAILLFFNARPILQLSSTEDLAGGNNPVKIWTSKTAWLITLFNFIHVGIETGFVGWLTTYSERFPDSFGLVSATPVYFLFFVIGRGLASVFLRFLSINQFLLTSIFIFLLGILLILSASNYLFLLFGASVAGLGTSGIFPTNLARFTKVFGESAMRQAAPYFILGGLGGAFTTWLIGFVSYYSNNLKNGIFLLLISCILLIPLQIALISRTESVKS